MLQRLTDQNFIPLNRENIVKEKKDYTDFMKEYIAIPEAEAHDRLEELAKKRLTVLYQAFGPQEYSLIGTRPEASLQDVILYYYGICSIPLISIMLRE